MRPSQLASAAKGLSIVLQKCCPNPETFCPRGPCLAPSISLSKKNTQPSAYNHCISWEWGIWGLRLRHHALLFFCFYQSMLAGARGAGVRQLKQSVLFNSTLLQPCGVLAAGGVSTGVGWAAAHVRWDLDRAAAAALSCLALGLSDSQP